MIKHINYLKRLGRDFVRMRTRNKLLVLGVLAIIVVGAFVLGRSSQTNEVVEAPNPIPQVSVKTVAELSGQQGPLRLLGTISSQTEVVVRSESQGALRRVNYSIGDNVSAGAILAEVSNSSERAAVSQAQGALNAAQAQYDQVVAGAKGEEVSLAVESLQAAEKALTDTKKTQDILVDNALKTMLSTGLQADHTSLNPQGATPTISGFYDSTIQGQYKVRLFGTGSGTYFSIDGLEVADQKVQTGLPVPLGSRGLYITFPIGYSTLDQWIISIPNKKGVGYLQSLNAYEVAKSSRTAAVNQAEERVDAAEAQLALVQSGATGNQLSVAQAGVDQARAALSAAQARLEKTIIRSPLAGTITDFSISLGDFVSVFEPVATVANNGTLETVVYITEADLPYVTKETPVTVAGYPAVVSSIAPAISSTTGKIEVKVILPEETPLTNGQSVSVLFERNSEAVESLAQMFVPLSALRVGTNGVAVMQVVEDLLVEIPVRVGPVVGDRVLVLDGLEPTSTVVVDVRGLKPGQPVSIVSES